jgi:glycosyltransferase involved in cell wall biosynthesis
MDESMTSKPKRVLHVSTWQVPCGIATYCDNLVKSLANHDIESRVAPVHPSDWEYCLPQDILEWRESVVSAAESCDLVHIQHEHGLFGHSRGTKFAVKQFGALLRSLKDRKKPVVTTFHTDIVTGPRKKLRTVVDRFRKKRMWIKHVARQFGDHMGQARAIVHSMGTRLSYVKHGFPAQSIFVVPHACLPPKNITLSRDTAKEKLGLPEDAKLLTIFGFLGRYKGHDLAIEALKYLPENYHLALVGGMHPEARDDFLDVVLQSIPEAIRPRVKVTGWVESSVADLYYAATDVCLAPYRGDTLLSASGAVTWALSSGRPVVASKIEAFQNVNRGTDCMFLFTPERLAELAWAVEKIVSDTSLQERLIRNARAYCEEHSWQTTSNKVLQIYDRMMSPAGYSTTTNQPPARIAA